MRAHALTQVATIDIPGTPINQMGVMTIDQATGLGYLADKDNKAVVVFDTKNDKYVGRIGGFVGMAEDGDASGPNGVLVVAGGSELWVSDGDSTVKIVDLESNAITATISTGGKRRANGMALDPVNRIVLVANSDDEPPYFSLVCVATRKVLTKIPVPQSAENLERSGFHEPSGSFFTVIPVLARDASKGVIAQTASKSGELVKLFELDNCHPHSLQIVSPSTMFLGCSDAHGASPEPGGDLAIFDIASGKIARKVPGHGGNGGSAVDSNLSRYYHSTTAGTLMVVDLKSGEPIEKVKTWTGARSVGVSQANNRVYLATTAKGGPCNGCIVVFAPK